MHSVGQNVRIGTGSLGTFMWKDGVRNVMDEKRCSFGNLKWTNAVEYRVACIDANTQSGWHRILEGVGEWRNRGASHLSRKESLVIFFFRLFPSGVAKADFPSPVVSINCILLRHFNLIHVFFHHIHKPPFWPSPFPLSWQLHPQHPSPNIPIIFPP